MVWSFRNWEVHIFLYKLYSIFTPMCYGNEQRTAYPRMQYA